MRHPSLTDLGVVLVLGIGIGVGGKMLFTPEPSPPESAIRSREILHDLVKVWRKSRKKIVEIETGSIAPEDPCRLSRYYGRVEATGRILARYSVRMEDIDKIGADIKEHAIGNDNPHNDE